MSIYIWTTEITEWRLPSEYQEVEWIGRNGNNYIDTWWIPTTNFKINLWYKIADSWYRYLMMGNYWGNDVHSISLEINSWSVSNNSVRFYCWNTSTTQFYSSNYLNLNSFNDITISAPWTINLNWTTTTSSMYSWSYDNKTCRIFIDRWSNFSTFSHDSFISYCKIYEWTTLVRDLVPCYRKSDSVIWLYDLVNNQFYTNSWTWTFSKWSDVTYKWIYVWTTPVKEVYVWTKQVRPSWWEYRYDFRNKSNSQLQTDWWSLSNTTETKYNSDWIYANGDNVPNIYRNLWVSLNTATYIKYTINWKFIGDYGMWASLTTRVNTDDTTQNWLANNRNGSNAYASVWWYLQNTRTYKHNLSAWNYVQSLKFDFINKTILLYVNGTAYTGTLTDANITSIRSNNNIKLYFWQYPSTTTQVYISSIWIEVWL